MFEFFIYDAVRRPREGRKDGALHGVTPVQRAAMGLSTLRDLNQLDTAAIDDVIPGSVESVGEQGANIARIAALHAGYDLSAPGFHVNRFCPSGLEACKTSPETLAQSMDYAES